MATQSIPTISEEEYLRREREAWYKSELVRGEIFAMAGGSLPHGELAANWIAAFKLELRGRACHVFSSDVKIRTPRTGSYVYPDVSVVCGRPETHPGADDALTNPLAVIEVVSPSTADYDRGKKFELYREIPSLQEYILSHTDAAHVEHYARQTDGSWIFREYRGPDAAIPISSLSCTVALAEIYAGVLEIPG